MEASKESRVMSQLPNLPPEIISDILLNLPVRSLLKFRSVSKSWLSLISSSKFIKTHLNHSTKSNIYSKYSFILATQTLPIRYYTCSLSSILCNTVMDNSRVFDFPRSKPDFLIWFVGTCNGLLCVSVDPDTIVLYNPSIRKLKTLPVSGTDTELSSYMSFGFCYDELNDDYKVVELSRLHNGNFVYCTEVKVYSLRNDSWRRIENDHVQVQPFTSGGEVSVGSIIHWRTYMNDGSYRIFAVNTVTYRYHTLAHPKQYDRGAGGVKWRLGELDGCLSAFYDYYKIRLDVWVLKEYGVEESWTKLLSIAYPGDPERPLWPLFVLKNGDIFLDYGPYLMLYSSRNNSFTTREIQSIGGMCSVAAPAYIESLVAPSLVGEQ